MHVVARGVDVGDKPINDAVVIAEQIDGIAAKDGKLAQVFGQLNRLRQRHGQFRPRDVRVGFEALAHAGKQADAAAGAAKLQARVSGRTQLLLQLARCYAVCAATEGPRKRAYLEQALAALKSATRDDYRDAVALQTDPDLASLRSELGFEEVITAVKGRR